MSTRTREIDSDDEGLVLSKRSRAELSGKEDDALESDDAEEASATLASGEDGFVEGSIVKIVLRNFVTYDYCEFYPGPQLNMIIGPNGTGKSTIVCAVALGLGGAPSLLGRAKNIAEFVKTGEDEAMIQIELKKLRGRNVVIQRRIQKANNTTTWKMNGRATSQKEVLNTISTMNIQVDNLCQFLPQDKVAEFAQLLPHQLLERTQVAAGAKDLTAWQQSLIEKRQEQKELLRSHESDVDHLKGLQLRNQELEKDVVKMRQREAIMKRVALLKAKLPLARYSDAKQLYDEARAEEQEKREELERLKALVQPLENQIREWKDATERTAASRDAAKQRYGDLGIKVKKCVDDIENSKAQSLSHKTEIEDLKKREIQQKKDIAVLVEKVSRLKEITAGGAPAEGDVTEINQAIESINEQLHSLSRDFDELRYDYRNKQEEERKLGAEIASKNRELEELKNVQRQRALNVQRNNPDSFKAYQWLQQNRSMFKGRIYGPVQMLLNLKDKRYADMVETILGGEGGSHMRTFVCEYQEDYRLFSAKAVDELGLSLTVSWPGEDTEGACKTPMTDEELKQRFGMDHFIVNLLEAPKTVMLFLCNILHVHQIPVSLGVADESLMAEKSDFRRYVMRDNVYEVKRYSYGRGGSQTTVRRVFEAKILNDAMDNESRLRITQAIRDLEPSRAIITEALSEIDAKRTALRQKMEELKQEKEDNQAKKRDMQQERVKYNRYVVQLGTFEDELRDKRSRPVESQQEIEAANARIVAEAEKRVRFLTKYKDVLASYTDSYLQRNVASLDALQTAAKFDSARTFFRTQTSDLKQAQEAWGKTSDDCKVKKNVARRLDEEAKQAGANLLEELADEFREILETWRTEGLGQTAIEVEDAINAEKAKADALKFANPRAMEQYETRLREIKVLTEKIGINNQRLDALKGDMESLRSQWEPRLESLVSRINDEFSLALQRIGCAGEVCVSKDEDFDKWGIEILVKFRDHEKLQLLTGQRQSGGERAVSTILYMMALQGLAKAPFRVVDEINQGMDPRNERMIHEQIVKGASKPGTAQYFLITPKLLPDLYYNERMRVLCIYNGEWQPENMKPLSEFVKHARSTMNTNAAPSLLTERS